MPLYRLTCVLCHAHTGALLEVLRLVPDEPAPDVATSHIAWRLRYAASIKTWRRRADQNGFAKKLLPFEPEVGVLGIAVLPFEPEVGVLGLADEQVQHRVVPVARTVGGGASGNGSRKTMLRNGAIWAGR